MIEKMTKILNKFKTETSKKVDAKIVIEADLKEFQNIVLENAAWVDVIREALVTAAKTRYNLKTKVLLFWKRISPKYHLDESKVYDINPKTGEITLSKNQFSNKEVKK